VTVLQRVARPAAPGSAAGGGGPRSAAASAQEVVASHRDDGTGELFGITELCREFGITLRTIRFYEDKGLLAPRRVNGTRVYTRRDRARLALILRSKAIGASLAEIKHYLDLYGAGGEGRVQQLKYVLQRTDAAIDALEQKRAHIEATLAELRVINAEVRKQLDAR
jgi:DNA-binding transcriptional MerR regulator